MPIIERGDICRVDEAYASSNASKWQEHLCGQIVRNEGGVWFRVVLGPDAGKRFIITGPYLTKLENTHDNETTIEPA